MVSTNQCFYRDTIPRKTAIQGKRVLYIHETISPLLDADHLVFCSLWVVSPLLPVIVIININIIIVIIVIIIKVIFYHYY